MAQQPVNINQTVADYLATLRYQGGAGKGDYGPAPFQQGGTQGGPPYAPAPPTPGPGFGAYPFAGTSPYAPGYEAGNFQLPSLNQNVDIGAFLNGLFRTPAPAAGMPNPGGLGPAGYQNYARPTVDPFGASQYSAPAGLLQQPIGPQNVTNGPQTIPGMPFKQTAPVTTATTPATQPQWSANDPRYNQTHKNDKYGVPTTPPGKAGGNTGTGGGAGAKDDGWGWARDLSTKNRVDWDIINDVYLNPNRNGTWGKFGSPEQDVAAAIREAREDGAWAQAFMMTQGEGRPPNETEWVEHYYFKNSWDPMTQQYRMRDPILGGGGESGHENGVNVYNMLIEQMKQEQRDQSKSYDYVTTPPPNNW